MYLKQHKQKKEVFCQNKRNPPPSAVRWGAGVPPYKLKKGNENRKSGENNLAVAAPQGYPIPHFPYLPCYHMQVERQIA
jgi:hypothetical protein